MCGGGWALEGGVSSPGKKGLGFLEIQRADREVSAHFTFLFKSLALFLESSSCDLGLWREKHFSPFVPVG